MKFYSYILVFSLLFACTQKEEQKDNRFTALPSTATGVNFSNDLVVNDSINFFNYGYYYMGGGVAIGDVNNDGLQDIYFSGNNVENKLFLNKGNLQFEDITTLAGVGADNRWITGIAMTDINADGKMDISVSVAGIWASTKNILYVNQGNNANGIPTFKDEAEKRGVADAGMSIQTAFFDYDQDGDIDLYVANYEKTSFGTLIRQYKEKVDNPVWATSDHLYENDGNGFFTDVTEKAGLLNFGLAVGVIASDFNNDNLTDLYVSNDFNTPDNFYFNNGDGTFTDKVKETTQHTAFYGMGVDAADINNDGRMDFMQVDMTPADNFRSKANMASMDIDGFWENIDAGFHYQYMFNALQINNGIRENGDPFFSDLAKISGMDKTDWSWASLFADYDNDGFNDLYITNGTRRDINNKDFFKWMGRLDIRMKIKYKELSFADITEKLPFKKVDNYMFKNVDGINFQKTNAAWGIEFEGFSNGAAYADLDNDGDLEMVLNNIDSVASIFENHSSKGPHGFVRIQLKGPERNPLGLGAKVKVHLADRILYKEHTLVRGYQSSVEPILHFGIGEEKTVSRVEVVWPDGKSQDIQGIEKNNTITIDYLQAKRVVPQAKKQNKHYFTPVHVDGISDYIHQENEFDDYKIQVLLPHRMSRLGPAAAVGDVNGDGLEDLFVGGAKGMAPQLLLQNASGGFINNWMLERDSIYEDVAAQFFDADGDGDLDLYVVSGGNESPQGSDLYQDRLYENRNGAFVVASYWLPTMDISGGTVLPLDFDMDGDLDLFIGGRQTAQKYPLPSHSIVLENKISEGLGMVQQKQESLKNLGMVADAAWLDLDGDGANELVVVGEWMPISVFKMKGGVWVNQTESFGLDETVGWWNTIALADFDKDGDQDMVVGNLGLNYKYQASKEKTFDIYASDYDANNNIDIVLGYYEGETQFPVRGMQCSSEQIPDIQTKFKSKYDKFASASLIDIYSEEKLQSGLHYKAQQFASMFIENRGKEGLKMTALPVQVQASSINSIEIWDWNNDGHLDILAGGNLFSSEIETPRNDACFGWALLGNGENEFTYAPYATTGIYVPYDIKHLNKITINGAEHLLFLSNMAPATLFKWEK